MKESEFIRKVIGEKILNRESIRDHAICTAEAKLRLLHGRSRGSAKPAGNGGRVNGVEGVMGDVEKDKKNRDTRRLVLATNLVLAVVLVGLVAFTATGLIRIPGLPVWGNNPTTTAVTATALLSDITMKDGFQYRDYPWFISESDFFAKSKMDEKTAILSQQGTLTLISDKQTQTYDVPKISMFPVYYFSSGKLTKVQLNAVFVEVNAFSACAKDLKIALDEYLKPRNGNTDFLDEVPPDTGEGLGMVTWAGNDSSGMVIATFNHTKAATDSNNYVISIEISPPGTR